MKIRNQTGFAAVEALLIVIILGLIGGTGYYVWHSKQAVDKATAKTPSSSAVQPLAAYKRTTTQPSSWKTYTNNQFKFTAGYPSDWQTNFHVEQFAKGKPDTSLADWLAHATTVGELCYMPKGVTENCDQTLIVANQTLDDELAQLNTTYYHKKDSSAPQVLSEKHMTIDGHSAVEVRYRQQSFPVARSYYVYANGYTYALPTVYESDDSSASLSAQQSLELFEAVKIQ